MSYDVICAGVIYLDLTFAGLAAMPRPGEEHWANELALSPGGMANTAVALARLGLRTAVAGAIGTDLAGDYMRGLLESEGIACIGPRSDRSAVSVVLPVEGDRALVSHLPEEVASADAFPDLHPRAWIVLVDQVARAPRTGRTYAVTSHEDVTAVARGAPWRLDGCDAVLTNEAEALALTSETDAEAAAVSLSHGATTAIVTLGARGAIGASHGEVVHVPAPQTEVRDATGAGDLFVAAYVWADLGGCPLVDRLRWATVYASRSLHTLTAFAGAATLAELTAAADHLGLSIPTTTTRRV